LDLINVLIDFAVHFHLTDSYWNHQGSCNCWTRWWSNLKSKDTESLYIPNFSTCWTCLKITVLTRY